MEEIGLWGGGEISWEETLPSGGVCVGALPSGGDTGGLFTSSKENPEQFLVDFQDNVDR